MTATYVVDASVVVKWFLDEGDSRQADALAGADAPLLAPNIVTTELANALWKQHRRGVLEKDAAAAMLKDAPRYFTELVDPEQLLDRAFSLATTHDHPVYDCLYLALAEDRNGQVVTADQRLLQRFAGTQLANRILALADFRA